jgi:hypothetical protein
MACDVSGLPRRLVRPHVPIGYLNGPRSMGKKFSVCSFVLTRT